MSLRLDPSVEFSTLLFFYFEAFPKILQHFKDVMLKVTVVLCNLIFSQFTKLVATLYKLCRPHGVSLNNDRIDRIIHQQRELLESCQKKEKGETEDQERTRRLFQEVLTMFQLRSLEANMMSLSHSDLSREDGYLITDLQ